MPVLLPDLAPAAWALLGTAAVLVGVSKTALPGINTVAIAIFAAFLPARESTGALLVLLLVGDAFALLAYRWHADWRALISLIPSVAVGLILGGLFLALADDTSVRRLIGGILLALIAVTLWQRRPRPGSAETVGATLPRAPVASGRLARVGYGTLGGFTTMVANAGGPVMSLYFLAAKLPVRVFLGTAAWLFAVINLAKLPVSIGLGLIGPATLWLDLFLVPGVVCGSFIGRWISGRIPQRAFEWAVIGGTVLGALYLLLR